MKSSSSFFGSRALLMALAIPFFVAGCGDDKKTAAAGYSGVGGSSGTGVLYGANGASGTSATLYTLNPATGAIATTIGPIGRSVTGMAVRPGTGVLYGVTTSSGTNPLSLITINKTTGAGTLVAALSTAVIPVADISFAADGTLYGWSEQTDDLVTINLTTGAVTVVGPVPTISAYGSGLAATSAGGLLFAGLGEAGPLHLVDRTTGAETVAATLNGSAVDALPISALAFSGSTLYGVRLNFNPPTRTTELVTINTASGAITVVGPSVDFLDAIAFDIY